MRVLFDVNVFISYLLPTRDTKKAEIIHTIVEAGFEAKFTYIFPQELFSEMRRKLTEKSYLLKHITKQEGEEFLKTLSEIGEVILPITEDIPAVTRDSKDDYLLAYALVGECDYLVTGDDDLLVLQKIEQVKIVAPAQFYEILKKQ